MLSKFDAILCRPPNAKNISFDGYLDTALCGISYMAASTLALASFVSVNKGEITLKHGLS